MKDHRRECGVEKGTRHAILCRFRATTYASLDQMKSQKEIRVAMISLGTPFNRSINKWVRGSLYQRGIRRVAEFSFKLEQEEFVAWKPDAVVAHIHNERIRDLVRSLGVPAINSSKFKEDPGLPTVSPDNVAMGRQAAEHLLESGYQHFAYSGRLTSSFSKLRLQGFRDALSPESQLSVYSDPHPNYGQLQRQGADPNLEAYQHWLRSLPSPTGILAEDDHSGMSLLETLNQMNLQPGADIGVISGHDLQVSTYSALTTIPVPFERWGEEAAKLLLHMLASGSLEAEDVFFLPGRVRRGDSTCFVGSQDPAIREAIQFIQVHAHLDISVDHVADAVKIPKRTLQRKFKQELERSISSLIRTAHIERAKQILGESHASLHEIARSSGLSNQHRLIRVFKEVEGLTPGEYRQQHGNSK